MSKENSYNQQIYIFMTDSMSIDSQCQLGPKKLLDLLSEWLCHLSGINWQHILSLNIYSLDSQEYIHSPFNSHFTVQ